MPLYTFYCCRADGAATTLEVHDLGSKEHAEQRAEKSLAEHRSCSYIAVFHSDVEVVTVRRLKQAALAPRVSIADNVGVTFVSGPATPGVPEPASWALMLVGFGGLGAMLRRRTGLWRKAQPA